MNSLTNAQRIVQTLDHLEIEQAHFAAKMEGDWVDFAANHRDRIRSLTLVCPETINADALENLASRVLLISGDQPPFGERILQARNRLPGTQHLALEGYANLLWNDPIGDHLAIIEPYLRKFLKSSDDAMKRLDSATFATNTGDVAGVSYQLQGRGSPLVLLPLGLAPTQWDKLIVPLSEHHFTVLLGGPELGILPLLEHRGRSPGYQRLMRTLFYELQPQPGERILDIGCGSGVVDRWLLHHTAHKNPMIGLDINPYLLKEAEKMVQQAGLGATIQFKQGNAESLPFADATFDITFSTTVMEEVNAKIMLAEMLRVTKPGGRIGVVVRALDLPRPTSVSVRPDLKAKCEAPPPASSSPDSCTSVDLYRHFQQAALRNICIFPDFTVFNDINGTVETFLQRSRQANLTPDESNEWQIACALAVKDGSFFLTWPHHCAVGTKPI